MTESGTDLNAELSVHLKHWARTYSSDSLIEKLKYAYYWQLNICRMLYNLRGLSHHISLDSRESL